jgi:hypothetical protein
MLTESTELTDVVIAEPVNAEIRNRETKRILRCPLTYFLCRSVFSFSTLIYLNGGTCDTDLEQLLMLEIGKNMIFVLSIILMEFPQLDTYGFLFFIISLIIWFNVFIYQNLVISRSWTCHITMPFVWYDILIYVIVDWIIVFSCLCGRTLDRVN